jgi:ABC-type antimicrobial peptide transport system permease subunit
MLSNYFLVTFRSMVKNKVFIAINVFGMGLAIGCCLVAYFIYDYNSSFNSTHLNSSTLYRVSSMREFQNEVTRYGYSPMPLGNSIRQNVADVDHVVRYNPNGLDFRIGTDVFNTDMAYVDPEFFQVFTIEMISGAPLSAKNEVMITDELAAKYFKGENAVGKSLTQVLDSGKTKEFVVSGVFRKQPNNSSFGRDAFVHFENGFIKDPAQEENNWKLRTTLFIQVKNPDQVPIVREQLKTYAANNNAVREDFLIREFDVEPFEGMALSDSFNSVRGVWTNQSSPPSMAVGTAMMGLFIVLIACFNLTNTAIAVSSRRLKEIGIRKVMGSSRVNLIAQFIGETTFICFMALIVGILIGEFALVPAFNSIWSYIKLEPDYFGRPAFLIFTVLTLLFTGLVAGSYPAFYVSKFSPTSILKGKLKFGGTTVFSRVLLTFQFVISIISIVFSLAFIDNASFQRNYDLGFNKQETAFCWVRNAAEYEQFRNRLLQNPDVISIAGATNHIGTSFQNDPIKFESSELEADIVDVGVDYLKTVGLTLVAGRDFTWDSQTDKTESVIVTENLAKSFGWDDAIGKEIKWMDTVNYVVVGVIKDVLNQGVWRKAEPMMLRYRGGEEIHFVIASAPLAKMKEVRASMEAIHKELFPDRIARIRVMDEVTLQATEVNNNILAMCVFTGLVALFLSASGLFTLVSLNIIKKMKEIGVRKVLGASFTNLTRVINGEFFAVLAIAAVFGASSGGWLAGKLMGSIWDYFQPATTLTVISSVALMFVVAVFTVGYKIVQTFGVNPADVLRDE